MDSRTTPTPPPNVTNADAVSTTDASTKLAEAIDDFLGDLERKFKGISDEVLTKLDDIADRCDRLEQELLLKEASAEDTVGKGAGTATGTGDVGTV